MTKAKSVPAPERPKRRRSSKATPDGIPDKVKRCRTLVNLLPLLHGAARGSGKALQAAEGYAELCALGDPVAAAAEGMGLDSTPLHTFLHAPRPEHAGPAGAFLSRLLAMVEGQAVAVLPKKGPQPAALLSDFEEGKAKAESSTAEHDKQSPNVRLARISHEFPFNGPPSLV